MRQIQLSSHRAGQSDRVRSETTQLSSRSEIDVDEKPKLRTRAIEGLLRRILSTPITPVSHRTDVSEDRSKLAQDVLRKRDWAQLFAEPCGALISLLDRVDSLERKGVELSRATNWTYWSLGCAYRAFCEVRDLFGLEPSLIRSYTKVKKYGMIVLNRADCSPNYAILKASETRWIANGPEALCRSACYALGSMCTW